MVYNGISNIFERSPTMSQENFNVIPEDPHMDYNRLESITATGGARIGAHILDGIISFICMLPSFFTYFPQLMEDFFHAIENGETNFNFDIISFGWFVPVYELVVTIILTLVIPLLTKGKTIGKAIVGLRIISKNGDYATSMQLFIRSLIYIVPALFSLVPFFGNIISGSVSILWIISLIFIFTDRYHQAVHDKMSNTIVVYENQFVTRA
jgi:uncharacterized RDD family membrane protein YckC